ATTRECVSGGAVDVLELRGHGLAVQGAGVVERPGPGSPGKLAIEPARIASACSVCELIALPFGGREALGEEHLIEEPGDERLARDGEQHAKHEVLVDLRLKLELELRDRPILLFAAKREVDEVRNALRRDAE